MAEDSNKTIEIEETENLARPQAGDPAAPGNETRQGEAEAGAQGVPGLETEKQELQDRLLRLAAEFENYKKRMHREREAAFKYAEESLLKELLPSIDNLERALAQAKGPEDGKAMRQGVDLTLKALLAATAKFGLAPIDSVGQPFDPNLHEALLMEASNVVPPQSVLREFEKGYYYKDRLLRAAKVVVAKAKE